MSNWEMAAAVLIRAGESLHSDEVHRRILQYFNHYVPPRTCNESMQTRVRHMDRAKLFGGGHGDGFYRVNEPYKTNMDMLHRDYPGVAYYLDKYDRQEKSFILKDYETRIVQIESQPQYRQLFQQIEDDLKSIALEEERFEGDKISRYSDYYERDPRLRSLAIKIHGTTCKVASCKFNFQQTYGDHGNNYIEVHHIKPLGIQNSETRRKTNPFEDLTVVCPNCHRMIHRHRDNVLSLDEVDEILRENMK